MLADAPLAETGIARVADDAPGPPAMRTGLVQREEALRNAHLARTLAGIALHRVAALGSATAVAGFALNELGQVETDLHARREIPTGA